MLLIESRRPARTSSAGALNQPGPYQIQAAINAVHSSAVSAAATDWQQVLALFGQLMAVAPTPVVALNRAVAVAEVSGPAAGLALVTALAQEKGLALESYYLYHAIRADLLRRLRRAAEAAVAYQAAIDRTQNTAERAHLTGRMHGVPGTPD
jgi:RNA polymerase sigma-70 factor (ECF subfamily)